MIPVSSIHCLLPYSDVHSLFTYQNPEPPIPNLSTFISFFPIILSTSAKSFRMYAGWPGIITLCWGHATWISHSFFDPGLRHFVGNWEYGGIIHARRIIHARPTMHCSAISSVVETGSLGVLSKIVANIGNGRELIQAVLCCVLFLAAAFAFLLVVLISPSTPLLFA